MALANGAPKSVTEHGRRLNNVKKKKESLTFQHGRYRPQCFYLLIWMCSAVFGASMCDSASLWWEGYNI